MALTTTADPGAIAALLDPLVAADPVRATVLGTVRTSLGPSSWAARTDDGRCLAVRSDPALPMLVLAPRDLEEHAALAAALDALPDLAGLAGDTASVGGLAGLLTAGGRRRVAHRMHQRLFRLDTLTEPAVAGSARQATDGDRDLVGEWYRAFAREAGTGTAAIVDATARAVADGCRLWVDTAGRVVSLAARRAAVGGSARIGPVYTPPEYRGHGYGSAVTAAATRDVLDEGAVPVLFTDLGNPVSNAIYPRLGYRPVEDRLVVRFG